MPIERTTVRLPEELLRRAKRKAAQDGSTLTSLIEDGLRTVLASERRKAEKERTMPRVSRAKGGLMPGIDLTRYSEIQAMDDLEYAERLKNGFK